MGGALSTGGSDAHGDLTGGGGVGFATKVGLSFEILRAIPPCLGCMLAPSFKTLALGPTLVVLVGGGIFARFSSSCLSFSAAATACSSANAAAGSL